MGRQGFLTLKTATEGINSGFFRSERFLGTVVLLKLGLLSYNVN